MKGPQFIAIVCAVTIVEAAMCSHLPSIPVASLTSAEHKHAETKRLFHSTIIQKVTRAIPEKIIIPADSQAVNDIHEAQTEAMFQKNENMKAGLSVIINGNDRKLKVINGDSWKETDVNSGVLMKNVANVHVRIGNPEVLTKKVANVHKRNGNLESLTKYVANVHTRTGNRDVLTKNVANVDIRSGNPNILTKDIYVRSVNSHDIIQGLCHTAECIKALDEYLKWRNENGYPLALGRWGK